MRKKSTTLGHLLSSAAGRYRTLLYRPAAAPNPASWRLPAAAGASPAVEDSKEAKLLRLEAVLFLSREPISTRKLANLAKLADGTEARTLVSELARRYDQRSSAMQVVDVAGGVQLLTRPQLAAWIRRFHGCPEEMTLSAPALETLSVVAYRQPVVRAEVEAIRGVQCGEILRVLMERDFLRIVGRAEELGRPFLYGTTKKFLQVFGLRRLEHLPEIDQIRSIDSGV
ncbi:MAG: SMC-Scp complex subunit ScpB [Planctomycetales bacterium]|nr:SMC-Scp complex subunit ScpB [Planctomycetales bacterium]